RIMLDGHSLRLIDTAGLNPSPSGLEQLGMAKTLERAAEADIFLLVIDATHPVPALPAELMARLRPENTLVVLNKMDLTAGVSPADTPAGLPTQAISALTGLGLDKLIEVISRRASLFQQNLGEETIAINARHAHALARARRSLAQAREKIERGQPKELLASDIRDSLDALGEISGKIDNERMLDQLFAKFCIGK
ncbi:MAG TPA: GTPase, partial [Tepidisphaeraceae bacterium]|nr:GTPase [Tepidisphaeraceae bacterium]